MSCLDYALAAKRLRSSRPSRPCQLSVAFRAEVLITRALQENENLATMTALDDARLCGSFRSARN